MDSLKNMIVANGRIITNDVVSFRFADGKYSVVMKNGKIYTYNSENFLCLKNPESYNPSYTHFFSGRKLLDNIEIALLFSDGKNEYWHMQFADGRSFDYKGISIKIVSNCLSDRESNKVFQYLKQLAESAELQTEDGTNLLSKQYEKLSFIDEDCALAAYLNPENYRSETTASPDLIFPFGCNSSQFMAVKNAFENQISVIQGPPGTGKTQTILNIIANILLQGKTVQVVSNNNSATANVFEKMSSEKYGLGFVVAPLGSSHNKNDFINAQTGVYPDISSWNDADTETSDFLSKLSSLSAELSSVFSKQELLALAKHELNAVKLEYKYFEEYFKSTIEKDEYIELRKKLSSKQLMWLLQECQAIADTEKSLSLWFKIKSFFLYGILDFKFYKQDISVIINTIQKQFYISKIKELSDEISDLAAKLEKHNAKQLSEEFSELSMKRLKSFLFKKYGSEKTRKLFTKDDFWKNHAAFQDEYPVILSTTFSSRSSLCKDATFDYLIMDEASQVDIATGALALSCAKNVIIVGDTKQLPNVVSPAQEVITNTLWHAAGVNPFYKFAKNSFLQSICDLFPEVPQTLLREHYRCHPKIIDFCNQKFYNGELVIMSEDKGEENVLSVIKTVKGSHARGHFNPRQIDVINNEILTELPYESKDIGIIAPYNDQVEAVKRTVPSEIDVATVHKFQGREKDAIILTTVDNIISPFVDDPYLLNVAISRAKKKLYLVVSGNEQPSDSNIADLISYIEYNNFEIKESKIFSIFDYLYKEYSEIRKEFLKKHKKISEYDSENLMYSVIEKVLEELGKSELKAVCHYQLNSLISDPSLLNADECRYAMNSATHVDFLIYNKIRKEPVLAIEVDGYSFHKEGSVQAERDKMKNRILDLYSIPYLRISTIESGEKEKLLNKLKEVL